MRAEEIVVELERLARLMRDLVSPDPVVRADAERRRRELLARAEAERRPWRDRVEAALDEALRRLRE
ncbi:hypothetical protein [Phytohabitans suffuscus]|uniref:Uncharacterized protein n=1 Tax=Phytohabitans suffuscus TaxID=624315 RepID=A0A6F8YYM1_9ACTN|nr:hypothetical protein [Phytohabitans suffuscus]BCB91038.1 hypothetical protein Psuf_083510 [Phytohabitans suffuscus]